MKKLCVIMLLTIAGILSVGTVTFATSPDVEPESVCGKQLEEGYVGEIDILENYIPQDINDLCNVNITRSASIAVPVTSPCDQKWRNKFPNNWMWQANRAITRADDELTDRYGIYYYSVAQKEWNSSSTTPLTLVKEAKNEWGLTNGAKLMIAFSGRNLSYTGDIIENGKPYAIIINKGYITNAESVQHETGHCYGLGHRQNDNNCVMAESGTGNIDKICTTHNNKWNNNKNKY